MEGSSVELFEGTFLGGLWRASAKGGHCCRAVEDLLLQEGCAARVRRCSPVTVDSASTEALSSSLLCPCHQDPLSLGFCAEPRRKAEAGPLLPHGPCAFPGHPVLPVRPEGRGFVAVRNLIQNGCWNRLGFIRSKCCQFLRPDMLNHSTDTVQGSGPLSSEPQEQGGGEPSPG